MEIKIKEDLVIITSSGIELLKLKASLAKCLGDVVKPIKGGVTFPFSCADIVASEMPTVAPMLSSIGESPFSTHAKAREIALNALSQRDTSLLDEYWKKILDLPQQFAVNAMITPHLLGLCLFDEQGSGKTVMTIAAFDLLRQRDLIDAMIIVCPKSMLPGWDDDLKKFLPNKNKIVTAQGNHSQKREQAISGFDVLISNYEGLEAMVVSLNAVASRRRFLLIVDESYYAKNEKTERSSVVTSIRSFCSRCFVLCGTPAPNNAYDLINQFNIADLGYTFSSFSRTSDITTDKNIISNLIQTRGTFIRRLKNEILNTVPEKKFHIIKVKLQGRQKEMYERARVSLALELRSYDNKKFKKNLTSYFQKRSALLQICSIPTNFDPTFPDTPAKYLKLDSLLNELFSENRKVIIWTFYKSSISELAFRYSKYAPLIIEGDTSSDERKKAVYEFQNSPDRLLFIANPSAAGAGITLHASHDAIYISYTNQAAHYLQSIDRIHRRGQQATEVNYYLFVCEGTIEETEVLRLRKREMQQHELLADSVSPTSLDEALAELSSPGIS